MKIQLPANLTGFIQSADYRKIDGGKVHFGEADKDPISYPADIFLNADLTVPSPSVLSLKMGYLYHGGNVVDVYVRGDVAAVSMLITDVYGRRLAYLPSVQTAVMCDVPDNPAIDEPSLPDVPSDIPPSETVDEPPSTPAEPVPDVPPRRQLNIEVFFIAYQQEPNSDAPEAISYQTWKNYLDHGVIPKGYAPETFYHARKLPDILEKFKAEAVKDWAAILEEKAREKEKFFHKYGDANVSVRYELVHVALELNLYNVMTRSHERFRNWYYKPFPDGRGGTNLMNDGIGLLDELMTMDRRQSFQEVAENRRMNMTARLVDLGQALRELLEEHRQDLFTDGSLSILHDVMPSTYDTPEGFGMAYHSWFTIKPVIRIIISGSKREHENMTSEPHFEPRSIGSGINIYIAYAYTNYLQNEVVNLYPFSN